MDSPVQRLVPRAPRLLDVQAVANRLGCSTRHVYRLAESKRMPAPIRLGALVRWTESEITRWIEDGCPNCKEAT